MDLEVDPEASLPEREWLRLLGRGVIAVQDAFEGRDDGELLTLADIRESARGRQNAPRRAIEEARELDRAIQEGGDEARARARADAAAPPDAPAPAPPDDDADPPPPDLQVARIESSMKSVSTTSAGAARCSSWRAA